MHPSSAATEPRDAPLHMRTAELSCCIVQLNWCNWAGSLACLESIFRLEHARFRVIWCDNDSPDGSVDLLVAWAEGRLDVLPDSPPAIRHLHWPPVDKPIAYDVLDAIGDRVARRPRDEARLVIVKTGRNDGCAAGFNVGLRLALELKPDYVWVLNTDTVVRSDALTHLLERTASDPTIGICGSSVFDFQVPERIHAQGGAAFDFRWCTADPLNCDKSRADLEPQSDIERRLQYVLGASMLLPRRVIEHVGLMPEHFFLYFEEIAWAEQMAGRYRLAYARASEVFHRDSESDPSSSEGGFRDSQMLGNRLLFAKLYRPSSVPFVICGLLWEWMQALADGKWRRVRMMCDVEFWRRGSRQARPEPRI